MIIKDYLNTHALTVPEFANLIGVKRNAIYRYMRKGKPPSAKVMNRIIKVTGGAIQPNDFFIIPDNTDSSEQNHVEQGAQHAGK